MLIKIENDLAVGLPILEDNFRQLHPSEVFPLVLSNEIVEPFGYAMYDFTQQPDVRWDEKLVEGVPTKDQYGIWRQVWQVEPLQGQELADRIVAKNKENIALVDRQVDALYGAVIGNRGPEYQQAEQDAQAFAQANYAGAVPSSVAVWAQVKGWSATQAADDILLQASQWRNAQATIRAMRLQHKENIRVANTVAAQDAAMAAWAQFVVAIKTQLGV